MLTVPMLTFFLTEKKKRKEALDAIRKHHNSGNSDYSDKLPLPNQRGLG